MNTQHNNRLFTRTCFFKPWALGLSRDSGSICGARERNLPAIAGIALA